MTSLPILHHAASEVLPEELFQQLTPYLEALVARYQEEDALASYVNHYCRKGRIARYNGIRAEFLREASKDWPAFARNRWPEIEQYFDLSTDPHEFDEVEF